MLPPPEVFPEFEPHPALRHPHVMTIASALSEHLRFVRPPRSERWTLEIDPETTVLARANWRLGAPCLVLAHGLTGQASTGYMRATAKKAWDAGFSVVRLNARNCGGSAELTSTLYHTGLTDDVKVVFARILGERRAPRVYLAGFSMGANVVLKAAGELGAAEGLAGVCAISPPIELAQASSAIDRGLVNAVYQESFLRSLRALVAEKARAHPGRYDPRDLAEVRSLRDFDDRFIAPCFGFRDADDYYARGSAGPWLPKIRVPTLVVHARDDSIIPFRPFEHWIAAGLPNVRFLTPARGGHVGFVSARPARNEHWRDADLGWAENRIVQFVAWLERARTR